MNFSYMDFPFNFKQRRKVINMKKLLLLTLSTITISFNIKAQEVSDINEKLSVISLVRKYSETVSCGSHFEEEKSDRKFLNNIYFIEKDTEIGSTTYFMLWDGDIGCNGGSGTHSYIVSEIGRYSESRPFLVLNENAFGDAVLQKINFRFIKKLQQVSPSKFFITSSEHQDQDTNNFPSNIYRYQVELIKHKWEVTSKEFLGKN